jgi:hypothetical protein
MILDTYQPYILIFCVDLVTRYGKKDPDPYLSLTAGRKAWDIPDVGWLLSPCPHKA